MKVYTGSEVSTDRTALKKPLSISGVVRKVRDVSKARAMVEAAPETQPISMRVEDRQVNLTAFYQLYEEFVESLCDGAQFGVSKTLEDRYQRVRRELIHRYAALRPFVGAFLRPGREGIEYAAQGIKFDAFDALLEPPTLELFLGSDDGNTISRISRTREALTLYGEHVRQLAKKMK